MNGEHAMYSFLYDMYYRLCRIVRRNYGKDNRQYRNAKKVIGQIESYYNIFLKRYYLKHPQTDYGITDQKREQKVIVSLTSFPARIDTVWLTIESLFKQSVKVDEIILWLAEEQFEGKASLPASLLAAEKRGLTIRFCDDLRSHKKYFYVMQEYPDDLIILADDDALYPRDMIRKLLELHNKYPQDIISSTSAITTTGYNSVPSQWHAPDMDQQLLHSYIAQPFTGSGTLYPPHSLSEHAFDKDVLLKICPYADDLWLFYMALIANTPVTAYYPYRDIPIMIYGTSANGLWHINGAEMQNDVQWRAILDYYGTDCLPEEEASK